MGCVGGEPEIADGLHSGSLPRTAQMNPLGKGGGLPRLLSISVLWAVVIFLFGLEGLFTGDSRVL